MHIKVKQVGARAGLGITAVKFPTAKGCFQKMRAALSS